MTLATDYTYGEDTNFMYRRFFVSYPNVYADGETLQEADVRFREMVRNIALTAINNDWIRIEVSVK